MTVAPEAASSTPASVRALTDPAHIAKLLAETIIQEQALDEELEQLLSKQEVLNANLKTLDTGADVLEVVQADAEHMAESIRNTCELAEKVSVKVRQLDRAQVRVTDTIARLTAISDRMACLEGVSQALAAEDYEAGAGYVAQFMELEEKYSAAVAAEEAGQAADQRDQLLAAKKKLEEVMRAKFAAASAAGDHEGALRFLRLYPKLGMSAEGLGAFCQYLRSAIATRARADYEALADTCATDTNRAPLRSTGLVLPNAPTFAGTLTNLFKDIALAVEENEGVLIEGFGAGALSRAVLELHAECDARGAQVLRRFIEQRQIARVAQLVGRRGTGEALPDPRQVEALLEEMLLLCQRSEEYNAFMLAKLNAGAAQQPAAAGSPAAANTFKSGQFNRAVHEMVGHYIGLEEFYLIENVSKAIRIDEQVSGALTSSMVDDVFYILMSSGRRAGATGSLQCVCAVINHINNLLSNEFDHALQAKIRGAAQRMLATATGTPTGMRPGAAGSANAAAAASAAAAATAEAATPLNNADVSADYVLKLKKDLEEHCSELFPSPSDRERIRSSVAEMADSSARFRALALAGVDELLAGLGPRLRPFLDAAAAASYHLTEAEYAENEADDPWVHRLLAAVDAALSWARPLLSTANNDALVAALVDSVAARLEAVVWQKRFNWLGGLQLERDVRTLVNQLSEQTARTVRDKFARLTQMATVLNVETAEEVLDFWGDNAGAITWRLTSVEVRRALSLRADLRPEAIQALKL